MLDPEGGSAGRRQRERGKRNRQPCGKMRKEAWEGKEKALSPGST